MVMPAGYASESRWRLPLMLMLTVIVALLNFHLSGQEAASVSLDPSWCQALDHASTHGLVFGHDVVFTFGPYGYLYCDPGLGQHAAVRLAGAGFLALALACLLVSSCRALVPWIGWPLLLWCATLLDIESRAYLIIALGALHLLQWRGGLAAALLVTTAMALLALMKFSFAVPSVARIGVVAVTLLATHRRAAALQVLAAFALAVLALWMSAGQPLAALPDYVRTSLEVTSGYAGAMSRLPPVSTLLLALLALGCLLALLIMVEINGRAVPRHGAVLIAAALAFVAWKRGFVRVDHLHVPGFFLILPVISILLLTWAADLGQRAALMVRVLFAALLLVSFSGLLVNNHYYLQQQKSDILQRMRALTTLNRAVGLVPASGDALAGSKGHPVGLPLTQRLAGAGSVDLISYEQGRLFLNHLNYRPRPVIQSYSAYTPALAQLNAAHFLGPQRPDFVLFDPAETIDGRLPMMDDGAALLVVLTNYRALGRDGKYLLLQRRDHPPRPPEPELLAERELRWGENVDLTAFGSELLAFSLEVTPSAAGRLAGLLFQSLPPQIVLDAGDGERRYRLVPGMLATPVLLSPHLRTSEDLLALGAPPPAAGFGHAVRRLRFEVAPPAPLLAGHEDFGRALYHDTLKLRLYRVRGLPDAGFTAAYSPDPDRVRAGP